MKTLSGCLKAVVLAFFVFFVIGLVASSVLRSVQQDAQNNDNRGNTPPASTTPQGWQYTQTTDDFDGSIKERLCITNTAGTAVQLRFPYNRATTASFCFRRPQGSRNLEAFVTMNAEAQFVCGVSGCRSRAMIDGQERQIRFSEAAAGVTNTIFVAGNSGVTRALFNDLEGTQAFRLEVEFYDHGRHTFEFPVSDLAWPSAEGSGAEGSAAEGSSAEGSAP